GKIVFSGALVPLVPKLRERPCWKLRFMCGHETEFRGVRSQTEFGNEERGTKNEEDNGFPTYHLCFPPGSRLVSDHADRTVSVRHSGHSSLHPELAGPRESRQCLVARPVSSELSHSDRLVGGVPAAPGAAGHHPALLP